MRHLVLCLALSSLAAHGAEPLLAHPPGPYPVGFRVIQQAQGRQPAQVLQWYPAGAPGSTLRYADYLATRLTALRQDRSPDELQALRGQQASRLGQRLGSATAQALLEAPMRATLHAAPAGAAFPVIVYAPGVGGPADENAELLEDLASHGYVVLSSIGMGADGKDVEESLAGVEPQVADIRALIRLAESDPQADARRLALLGWSWGGMTQLFAATQEARVQALVSLDGTREPELTRQIDVTRLIAPWLYVSRTPDTISEINRRGIDTRFSLLNEARHSAVTQLIVYPMRHEDFVSRRLREAPPTAYDEYSQAEVRQAFGMVALYVRHFLDAHLKQAPESRAFLARKPVENGAVPHTLRLDASGSLAPRP
ncbi:MAG: alpha/beta fold hydrolase [Inhella sp.]